MNATRKEQVSAYVESAHEETIRLLREIGRIPAPSHQEDQRAAFCRDWLLAQGAENVSIDSAKNVICQLGCDQYEDIAVFTAHTDIVFPDLEPLPMREEDGRLYAPGIGDDTANLVNLLLGAKYLISHKTPLRCGVMIVANACEEGLGNLDGTKELFRQYGSRIRSFISFDGYMPQCCSQAVGSYRYRLSCKTAGGHSYLNYGAANAIEILCRLTEALYQIKPPQEVKTTFNVGRFEGGTTVNSIAQEASLLYEFRSNSQTCLEVMDAKCKELIDSFRGDDREITLELLGLRPGNGILNTSALQEMTRKNAEIIQTFYKGEMDFNAYSTDSNIPLSMGIPANTIGTVSGALAHTRDEWIDLSSLLTGQKIVLSLLLQYAAADNI